MNSKVYNMARLTWYGLHPGTETMFWGCTIKGVKLEGLWNRELGTYCALGSDHDATPVGNGCGEGAPAETLDGYAEDPVTVIKALIPAGSGWLNLQVAANLHDPVRI